MVEKEGSVSEASKERSMKQGNISIILDSYNGLFSDFDPRPNSQRGLSDDFLNECRRAASSDSKEELNELRLLIPRSKRNPQEEVVIRRRLKNFFNSKFSERSKRVKRTRLGGILWFLGGVLLSVVVTLLNGFVGESFLYKLLFILMEPASWFFFWEGLYKVFITTKEYLPDYELYKKLSSIKINFHSY